MTNPSTAADAEPQDAPTSSARGWGALVDGVFLGILAVMACAIVTAFAQGSDVVHLVRSAAEAPIAIARAATATPTPQALIERAEWTGAADAVSLRVYPTEAAREASAGVFGADNAWAQVLAVAPDADQPGMREQFVCHWRFAELVAPGKVSWNLEPWRPVVNGANMIESRCNPGGAEESF